MSPNAILGRGTYLFWGNHQLRDILDIDTNGVLATTDTIEYSTYGSSTREYAPGYTDYGSIAVTLTANSDADATTLRNRHKEHATLELVILLPNGLILSAPAFITEFKHSVEKYGLYTLKLTFKLASSVTEQAFTGYHIVPIDGTVMYRGNSYPLYLALAGKDGSDLIGTNAAWRIVHPVSGVSIRQNILTLDESVAAAAKITVAASIAPIEGSSTEIPSVTYDVKIPSIVGITIFGRNAFEFTAPTGENTVTEQYNAQVYPVGGDTTAAWKLYKPGQGGLWEPVVDNDHIAVNNDGLVTISAGYSTADTVRKFMIEAKSTITATIIDQKIITLTGHAAPANAYGDEAEQ